MIQEKLQKHGRLNPDKLSIDSRLLEASLRRDDALTEIVNRSRLHCDGVLNTVHILNTQKNEDVHSLAKSLSLKANAANENRENIRRQQSTKIQEKMKKISRAKEMDAFATSAREEKIQRKMAAVEENREKMRRKQSTKMQERMEKINHAKEVNATIASELQEKIEKKMAVVEENKENMRRQHSTKMQEKSDKISRVKEMDTMAASELEQKIEKKMVIVEKNKENLRRQHSTKMQEKMERFSRAKDIDTIASSELEEKIEKKMAVVEENRENFKHQYSTKMQEKMEKISRAKHIDASTASDLEEKIENKMAVVEENKEIMKHQYSIKMQEKMEKISRVKELNGIATSELEEKIEKKMAIVEERKEIMKRHHSTKMQEKMEKISRAKEMDSVTASELEEKTLTRLNSAARRKSKILASSREKISDSLAKKSNQVEQLKVLNDSKWKEIKLLHESKLANANQRKMDSLSALSSSTASSTKKRIERARLHRLAQDADLSSLKKKLEDKMLTVSRKQKDVIATITTKAAEENKNIAKRTLEVFQQREINAREILCKYENKLEGASKQKQRLIAEKCDRKEIVSLRREKVFGSNERKGTILLPKTKQDLNLKLEEAKSRRTALLVRKSEHAKEMRSTSTKSSPKEEEPSSNEVFHSVEFDLGTSISGFFKEAHKVIFGFVVGFFRNIFGKKKED